MLYNIKGSEKSGDQREGMIDMMEKWFLPR
jgi:hypothetical protein